MKFIPCVNFISLLKSVDNADLQFLMNDCLVGKEDTYTVLQTVQHRG